jgi:hypothetical protein
MASAESTRRANHWVDSLTDEEIRRMAHGVRLPDELSFIESLQIEDKISGGLIAFKLWEFQKELIATLNEHDWTFVLKARQLGVTWVVAAHLLWQTRLTSTSTLPSRFSVMSSVLLVASANEWADRIIDRLDKRTRASYFVLFLTARTFG